MDKAIELNPEYGNTWIGKRVALANLGRHEDALECYDKALELNPKDKKAWYCRGHFLEQHGQTDEAQKCIQKAEELSYQKNSV